LAKAKGIVPVRGLVFLLLGAVVIPAFLSIAVGVIALALSKQAVDIVFGVLILCFAVSAIVGGFVSFALLGRSARLAQLQSDFVANISHELRTPIAGIRVLGEAISLGRVEGPDKSREIGDLIVAQAQRLQDLVERILQWRQLEAGVWHMDRQVQSLTPVVDDATRPYLVLPNGGAKLEVNIDPNTPTVFIDRSSMVDVVRNLVDNAMKFCDSGIVEVVVCPRNEGAAIEVRDQGPGIPHSEHKRIFERFYRAPLHLRSNQGAGLGLSIVESLVRDHHGRIEVHSEPGIGSTFVVWLPAAQAPPTRATATSDAQLTNTTSNVADR